MQPMSLRLLMTAALAIGPSVTALADGPARHVVVEYENLTKGQGLSTSAFVTHVPALHLWTLGKPADLALRMMAEEGNPEWVLGEAVEGQGKQFGDAAAAIPEPPGQKRRVELAVTPEHPEISGVIMIGQTNDGFIGVDAVEAYHLDKTISIALYALEAGSAKHLEDKAHLRAFGGLGREDAGGVVGPHPGLKPDSDVPAAWRFDPKQPIARVTITPVARPAG